MVMLAQFWVYQIMLKRLDHLPNNFSFYLYSLSW
jgi:hypothetical protein